MRTDTGESVHLEDYAPTLYAAPKTTLMFALHPTRTVVRNQTRYEPRGQGASGAPLELLGDGLLLLAAELDGMALRDHEYEAGPDHFTLTSPPRRPFTLTLTTGVSPDDNTQLMGLYRSNGVYCTQCEAEGFRRITYAYDRPDVLTVYDVLVMADEALAGVPGDVPLLSNGNLTARSVIGGRPSAHWHDPFPKPTYLFALVAGDLARVSDTFTTRSGKSVDLGIYVEHGKEARASYAMDALKRSMRWDEERFGLEYDLAVFNIVAVSDFNMGAMENKGLNVFNDRYVLADPEVATDADYAGIETVIAHEYFHNWTGNRITCRDWFQLSLKEGLTVFRDQEFTSDERSRGVKRVADVRRLRSAQFPEDASPLRHPVRPSAYAEISNLYTSTVYDKGAEVIRMIHTMIGEDRFRAGMARYVAKHDGTAATVEDFVACFDVPDRTAFMRWYEEAGTPTVAVEETFAGGRYTLELSQRPAEGASVKPVPIRLALHGATGRVDLSSAIVDGTLDGELLILGERASIALDGLNEPPVASLLRGFSAPVSLDRAPDASRNQALAERDDDPFVVWDATQRLVLAAMRARYDGGEGNEDALAHALTTVALADAHEAAFRALVLTLPTRQMLVDLIGVDVDATRIDAAHKTVTAALGERMADALAALHDAPTPRADDLSADAAGARALRNAALHLLTFADDGERAAVQADAATTMTDRLAAVGALAAAEAPSTDEVLEAFEQRFASEPLVLDKWFALQATRPDDHALERVRSLMEHPKFSLKNPNRTRSLIGAFAQNLAAFHAPDGSGYRFLAEIAIALDATNPQVAARLLTAFGDVRRFDGRRREAAAAALAEVLTAAKSSDVKDIARRLTAAG